MGLAVVTVATGGMPVVDVTAIAPMSGTPVTETANGYGVPVTKVIGKPGLPVVFETIGLGSVTQYATWDGTTTSGVDLSNGNLTVTHNSTATNSGVKSKPFLASGKYYFEVKLTARVSGPIAAGIINSVGTFSNVIAGLTNCTVAYLNSGNIASNDVTTGKNITISALNDVICIAVDLSARKAWLRENAGLWNGTAGDDPATAVGGVVVGAGSFAPVVAFGTSSGAGDQFTSNFGASAFAQAVPVGFTPGWPA